MNCKNCQKQLEPFDKFCSNCGTKFKEDLQRPLMKQRSMMDLKELEKILTDYVNYIESDEFHEDNDYDHFIYECVIKTFYGEEFWEWLRTKQN